MSKISIVPGDLTNQPDIDSIVNAANDHLRGGAGVCGAIFRAAGWGDMQDACNENPDLNGRGMRCPTGWSKATPAFKLPNKSVIHAVGPVYDEDAPEQSALLLRATYNSSLKLAEILGHKSIAFPAISCGVYGYPWDEAARIALETCDRYLRNGGKLEEIRFVIFEPDLLEVFEAEGEKLVASVDADFGAVPSVEESGE